MEDTKRIVYVGAIDQVYVPDLGAVVTNGEAVDVPAELADRLLEQETWELAAPKGRKPASLSAGGDTDPNTGAPPAA